MALRLGRHRPIARCPRLSLGNYLGRKFPATPAEFDYSFRASSALAQMYGNDQLGDCVIAGMAHIVGTLTGNVANAPVVYPEADIVALYSAIGGYVPGDPSTDQGCDEQTALNYWQQTGAPTGGASHQIAGWLAVDGSDLTEVTVALWLFENLVFGVELPDAWISPPPSASGWVWDVAGEPDPQNGHCFVAVGRSPGLTTIASWGMLGQITDAALAKYTKAPSGELYTVVSQDALASASQLAPTGFDWSQLIADFDSMGGHVT